MYSVRLLCIRGEGLRVGGEFVAPGGRRWGWPPATGGPVWAGLCPRRDAALTALRSQIKKFLMILDIF